MAVATSRCLARHGLLRSCRDVTEATTPRHGRDPMVVALLLGIAVTLNEEAAAVRTRTMTVYRDTLTRQLPTETICAPATTN